MSNISDSVIHAVAGGAAGMISMSLTYPLVVLSTRAAVAKREAITSTTSGSSSSSSSDIKEKVKEQSVSTLEAIRKVIAEEGLAGLYSGLSSSIVGIAATNTVFYLFFEESKAVLLRQKVARAGGAAATLSTLESMLSSTIAGAATTVLTNPIWVVQTYQATRATVAKQRVEAPAEKGAIQTAPEQQQHAKKRLGMLGAAKEILDKSGPAGLWKGLGPALILVINPVLQYTAFEQFAKLLASFRARRLGALGGAAGSASSASTRRLLSDVDMFILGALSKLLATGVTYPYVLVKSRLQASSHQYANSFRAVLDILRDEGVAGLYRGIGAKLLQSVMTAAFLFVAQRRVFEVVKMLLQLRALRVGVVKA